MKRITGFIVLIALILISYSINSTLASQAEKNKQRSQVVVSFDECEDSLWVTVIAPKEIGKFPFCGYSFSLMEDGETTFMTSTPSELMSHEHITMTNRPSPKFSFIVSQKRLRNLKLDLIYNQDPFKGTNCVVDLVSYYDEYKKEHNQQVDPIVTTPVDEVEAQGTQGHP